MTEEAAAVAEAAPVEAPAQESAPAQPVSPVARPEFLPEKFWNEQEGKTNLEGLVKSYGELERRQTQRASELRKELMEEIANREGVPKDAQGYEFKTPQISGVPEGWETQVNSDDPMLSWWRDTAFERKLTQGEFQEGIDKYFELHFGGMPDRDAELQSLGDNAQQRIDAVDMWLNKNLSEEEYNTVADFAVSAEAITVLEKIIGMQNSEPSLSSFGSEPSMGNQTEDNLRAMMDDPRYWRAGEIDDAYRAEVTKAWQKHYGG